jgi:hypothetical protein
MSQPSLDLLEYKLAVAVDVASAMNVRAAIALIEQATHQVTSAVYNA